jgi:hypothetical protein
LLISSQSINKHGRGQAVLEEKIFNNWPIRNKNCLWRPCLLMNRNKMSILYKGPSIDASYQVSVHLAEGFQRKRLKCASFLFISCIFIVLGIFKNVIHLLHVYVCMIIRIASEMVWARTLLSLKLHDQFNILFTNIYKPATFFVP